MEQLPSIIFYLILFWVVLLLFKNKNRVYHYIAISILLLFSIIRYDVGNDYFSYYLNIINLSSLFRQESIEKIVAESISEPSLTLICYIFRWTPDVAIISIGLYSTITILLWYKVLSKINGLFWGFFTIFFLCFLYNSYDQVRQALAMAIGLSGYQFIKKGELNRYLFNCCIAVFIHYSAIILFLFYFLRFLKTNRIVMISIIILMTYTFFSGTWEKYFERLFLLTSYADYTTGGHWTERQEFSSGLGALAWICINATLAILLSKKNPIISNIIFIGLIIYLFGSGNHLIERVSRYGTSFSIIGIPIYFNSLSKNIKIPLFKTCLILLIMTYGIKTTFGGAIGCLPYKTIFSKEYKITKFKPREGRWE